MNLGSITTIGFTTLPRSRARARSMRVLANCAGVRFLLGMAQSSLYGRLETDERLVPIEKDVLVECDRALFRDMSKLVAVAACDSSDRITVITSHVYPANELPHLWFPFLNEPAQEPIKECAVAVKPWIVRLVYVIKEEVATLHNDHSLVGVAPALPL